MIKIDVPQIAYKTWAIEYRIYNTDGTRNRLLEFESEEKLKRLLPGCTYSEDNDHVK